MYAVKEAFYTLQGEGARSGRAAVFCRFTGCNLWSGRARDRDSAMCRFCDTDFVGTDGQNGGRFREAAALAEHLDGLWPTRGEGIKPYVVFTGGEPLLQLDDALIDEMHQRDFEIAVETNGTIEPPAGVDWLCVSPKGSVALAVNGGNELKLVYPQSDNSPAQFEHLAFDHFYLQGMDLAPSGGVGNTMEQALDYCMRHPRWQLSIQMHKIAGID
ncbi:7-carboxy-7-deazaguanine synthase [Carnimonas sp. R-84981]|uniref:7-carboxy-7-deazaguanine synthase n=1 Tax=Carnimonas bestiolae TaxID=3402172 RepID=UPI003EDC0627